MPFTSGENLKHNSLRVQSHPLSESPSQHGGQRERRRELDALGNFVVLGLVFFHTAQIFSPYGLFIKDETANADALSQRAATVFIFFVTQWGMPLMFLIAGMAIWFSLSKRTAAEFARERVQRLLVPFLVGFFAFAPLNQYVILKQQHPLEAGAYLHFLRTFIAIEFDLTSPMFFKGSSAFFSLSHMWFLIYLFVYSLLLMPLFFFLRRPAGRRLLDQTITFIKRPWAIYLMGLPLAIIQAVLGTPNAAVAATWNLWTYVVFLVYGFIFAADGRIEQAAWQHRKSALVLGLLGFLVYAGGYFALNIVAGIAPEMNNGPGYIMLRFVQGLMGWCWIVAIVGLAGAARRERTEFADGAAHMQQSSSPSRSGPPSFEARLVAYVSEAQLPFYIMHMTPIVVIGFFVVQWEVGALVKYAVIVLSSLAVTLLLYEFGVGRTALTRFLFGMKTGVTRRK